MAATPESESLPMWAAKPRLVDWNYKSRLTPNQ